MVYKQLIGGVYRMYSYSKKIDKFETYVLEHKESNSYIEVVPARGCIVSKYVYQGESIFYLDQATLEDESKNIRGGNPILFPISSYLADETYTYEGQTYQLKQHGFARQLAGRVIAVHADDREAAITLELVDDAATRERYPFHFRLVMKYTLNKDGLTIEAGVTNNDSKTMPFYLGYHPYFYVEDKATLELTIPSSSYNEMLPGSMVNEQFNLEQSESNVIYDQLQASSCSMIDRARSLKVTVEYDEVYQYIVLWALQDKPFICIEPWMAPVNGMNVGKGIQQLAPNTTVHSTIRVRPQFV